LAAGKDGGRDLRVVHRRIMTDGRVGRLLPACLHEAIADLLPYRLDFYEEWLDPDDMRDGTVSVAATSAVLSFLRTEGESYRLVMDRAGTLAAEWTVSSLPAWRRRLIAGLPRALRVRSGLRVAAGVARSVLHTSQAKSRVRRGKAWLDVTASLFCSVREPQPVPLCGFYAAVAVETLRQFGVPAQARVEQCRAVTGATCRVLVEPFSAEAAPDPAIAA
jgi:hypothetical protein